MDNPFFKNNGPFKFRDILSDLGLVNDQNNHDQNIIYIKPNLDLNYTKLGLTNQTVKLPKDLKVNTLQPFFINKTNKILNLYPLFIINGLENKSFELKFY